MESLTVTPGVASTSVSAPVPAISSSSAFSPPAKKDWGSILNDWKRIHSEVSPRLAAFHRSFAEPVRIVNDEVQIHEYAMVAEKPYLVKYEGDVLEFTRKADGSIVVCELHISE